MKQAKTLTERELKLVLANCATRHHAARDRLAVLLGHWAGLRAKEIAALKLSHVLNDDGSIKDSFLLSAAETKGRKARRVFLSTRLQKEIGSYIGKVQLRQVNPYLLQAVIIAAGLDGLRSKADPGPRHDIDMYAEGHKIEGAPKLPLNLLDAIRAYDADEGLKEAMGQDFSAAYLKLKMQEWNSFVNHFSPWERDNTLDI